MTYLLENPPARSQFRVGRRLHLSPTPGRMTGCTVLHTAQNVMDSVGPDTGAEAVARFIVGRAEPGSYHDLADSDSSIQLVRYSDEAFQDGTGSNPWALSISWALAAADWPRLSPARRAAFLAQGAVAFRRQQAWLAASGSPLTPLVRITREQSVAGLAGFVTHGDRDPGRRTDPGADFPWAEWFRACGTSNPTPPAPTVQEDDVSFIFNDGTKTYLRDGGDTVHIPTREDVDALLALGVKDGRKLSAEMTARLIAAAGQ